MKNIKVEYEDYSPIIDKVGEAKINERLCAIHDVYKSFLEQTGFMDGKDIILNDRVLMHTILDYFTDITRLKSFHDIELINQDKIISYEISWMLRRKPIQVLVLEKEELIYVNEKFVLQVLVNHLTEGKVDDVSQNKILNTYCNVLFYYMKFRNCDAKVIEIIISSFKAGNAISKL